MTKEELALEVIDRLKKEYPVVKEEFTDDAQIVEFNLPLNRIPQVQEFLFNKQNF